MRPPIDGFKTLRINNTLHGRSRHRPGDIPGHNVFKGYSRPGSGDALDVFAPARTPVYPVVDGLKVTRWQNDATRKEVVYLEGGADGRRITTVYAHINFAEGNYSVGSQTLAERAIGYLRGDLNDPHLHFEMWIDGKALHGSDPEALRHIMETWFAPPAEPEPWYAADIAWAIEHGIMDGSRPDDPATRAETVAMIRRAWGA